MQMPTPVTDTDSFESRIAAAAACLQVTPQRLTEVLDFLGVKSTDPDALEILSDPEMKLFGELMNAMGGDGVKPLRLRQAVSFLVGKQGTIVQREVKETRIQQLRDVLGLSDAFGQIADADIEKLLEVYQPDKPGDVVTLELSRRFGDRRVILFRGSEVAIPETLDYVASLNAGMSESTVVDIDGEPTKPLVVGQIPNQVLEEDPMFPSHALWKRVSRKNHVDYNKVPQRICQFIRVLVEKRDLDPNRRMDIASFMVTARSSTDGVIPELFRTVFKETYAEFLWREKSNDLPSLMIVQSAVKPNNPFGGGSGNRKY